MSSPTEHKTVQARILENAEAIGWTLVSEEKEVIRDWRLDIEDSKEDLHSESLSSLRSLRFFLSGFRGFDRRERRDRKVDLDSGSLSSLRSLWFAISGFRALNRRERREHKEDSDSDSGSLSSLRSLRLFNSEFRELNRRERRDHKEDLDRAIWQQAAVKFLGWEFWHRLCQNLATACRRILEQAVQERNPAPEIP